MPGGSDPAPRRRLPGQLHRLAHLERPAGYATEAALAKAFKRERGETLGQYRATARGEPRIELAGSPVGG